MTYFVTGVPMQMRVRIVVIVARRWNLHGLRRQVPGDQHPSQLAAQSAAASNLAACFSFLHQSATYNRQQHHESSVRCREVQGGSESANAATLTPFSKEDKILIKYMQRLQPLGSL